MSEDISEAGTAYEIPAVAPVQPPALPHPILPGAESFFLPGGPTGVLLLHGFTSSPAEVRPLGEEFHRVLLKRAENSALERLLEQIREQIQSVWTMSILAPRRAQALLREHLAIIDALKRGHGSRAERLMRLHVRKVRDAIFRLVD